jgi:hypothetical protein
MKSKLLFLLIFLFTCSVVFAGESLGELAKKEKAKREALSKQGKEAKVYTNDDIKGVKKDTGIQSTGEEMEEPAEGQEEESTEAESTAAESEEYGYDYSSEADQQVNNQELQDLRDQREAAQKELDDARKAIGAGGLFHTRNVGDQFHIATEAERKLQEIDRRIKELEKPNQ